MPLFAALKRQKCPDPRLKDAVKELLLRTPRSVRNTQTMPRLLAFRSGQGIQ